MPEYLYVTLPVSGSQLAHVPEAVEAAERARALYGVNLLDDEVARQVVTDHLKARRGIDLEWHTEVGALLVLGGIVVAAVIGGSLASPVQAKQVAVLVAAILAVPAGIAVWAVGAGKGARKQRNSVHFTTYTALLARARSAGLDIRIPDEWFDAAGPAPAPAPRPSSLPPPPPAPSSTATSAMATPITTPPTPSDADGLLVVPMAELTGNPALAHAARALGAQHRIDLLDGRAVRAMLTAQRRAVRRWSIWAGLAILTVVAAVTTAGIGATLVPGSPERSSTFAAAGALAAVAVLATGPLLLALRSWRRSGVRTQAAAYLDLLVEARRRGVLVPAPPSWLDTRNRLRKPY
ncbi:hypothetical protein ABTX81_38925 [Kitasatospora sp. NPDC097605]|uniref:hypothetical protein n=1 Tax=Kitasatospora sp. NPDC097605 TaxID=3157226 RepID=UPI0033327F2F